MKITNAVFCNGQMGVTAEPVWQYDYGDELRICGLKLPAAVEIHFSLTEKGGESVPRVGVTKDNTTIVTIPDTMLENGDTSVDYNVYAWIYLADSESGHTEYKIRIPVCARAKPAPHDTPAEAELFQKAIDAVNESASRAEAAGIEARSWAIGGTGTRDGEDTDNTRYYAQSAAESAEIASEKEQAVSSAEVAVDKLHSEVVNLSSETSKNAENAAQSATAAGNSAAVASTSQQAAIEAAGRAARSESAAAESEKTATAAATAAEKFASAAISAQQRSEAAQTAAAKSASAATASESNASTLETAAAQSAKAAAESEKAAGASAAAASTSEQAATTAAQQTAADRQATETASAAAQQSAEAATSAQQSIQASADQIETNKTGIESLKKELVKHGTPVEFFGAIGDGRTDDTVALQNAFNSGLPTIVLSKTYYVSNTLTIPRNIKLCGGGKILILVKYNDLGERVLQGSTPKTCIQILEGINDVTISNISIEGYVYTGAIGIECIGSNSRICLEYLKIRYFKTCISFSYTWCDQLKNIEFKNYTYAVQFLKTEDTDIGCYDVSVRDCIFLCKDKNVNANWGVYSDGIMSNLSMYDCAFDSVNRCLEVNKTSFVNFYNCGFERYENIVLVRSNTSSLINLFGGRSYLPEGVVKEDFSFTSGILTCIGVSLTDQTKLSGNTKYMTFIGCSIKNSN